MADNIAWHTIANLRTSKDAGWETTNYSAPRDVGYFSTDETDMLVHDQSQLKYYVSPQPFINSDLKEGYEHFNRRDIRLSDWRDLHNVLRWILRQPSQLDDVEFVTRRATLAFLSSTRFMDDRKYWDMTVLYFNGKYYLSYDNKPTAEDWENNKLRNFFNHKFANLCKSDIPDGEANNEAPVNAWGTYYSLMKSEVSSGSAGQHSILFSYNQHCQMSNGETVFVKDIIIGEGRRPTWFVYMWWWLQSTIAGSSKIVYGRLSPDGILYGVDEVQTENLPTEYGSQREYEQWQPNCFNFLASFLKEVKRLVTAENPCVRFKCACGGAPVQYRYLNPAHNQLPDWYTMTMETV